MSKTLTLYAESDIKNERSWPQKYTRKFIEAGLVNYDDCKLGTLLLGKETIDAFIPSFIGKPVVIKHVEVSKDNFLDLAVGYITAIYFNALDGWYYVDFLVTHDEGHKKMDEGWGVSCFYKAKKTDAGGTHHNIPYDGEIISGEGEHLALVKNPRYEDCLMVVNEQPAILYNEKRFLEIHNQSTEDKEMLKIIGKKDDKGGFSVNSLIELANGVKMKIKDLIALANGVQDVHEVDEATEIDLGNGKMVKLADLVKIANAATDKDEESDEAKSKKKEEGEARDKEIKNGCDCDKADGKHAENCGMKNDKEEDAKKKDEEVKAANSKIAALENEVKALKEGAANLDTFIKVKNAKKNAASEVEVILQNGTLEAGTMEAGIERAKAYFSKN